MATFTEILVLIYIGDDLNNSITDWNEREVQQLMVAIERHLGGNYELVDGGEGEHIYLYAKPSCMAIVENLNFNPTPIYPGWDCDVTMELQISRRGLRDDEIRRPPE